MNKKLPRRRFLVSTAAIAGFPGTLVAETVMHLDWEDLIPGAEPRMTRALRGLVSHSEGATINGRSTGIRSDLDGQQVHLNGFIVPTEYRGRGVTAFVLVPYVGACIHVPPPPANQLVFVSSSEPYESSGLFEAVSVTGIIGAEFVKTDIAAIGYSLVAEKIESFSQ